MAGKKTNSKEFEFSDVPYLITVPEEAEVLHKPSVLVDVAEYKQIESFHKLIVKMKELARTSTDNVCGVSAIQLGIPFSMFVLQHKGTCATYINPQVQKMEDYKLFVETSLSSPGKQYLTIRANEIEVFYTTPLGQVVGVRLGGQLSAVFQQMVDSLVGVQLGDEDSPFMEYTEDIQYLTQEQINELTQTMQNALRKRKK